MGRHGAWFTQVAARELAQQIPAERWQRLSAGDGSKGPRLYDWGWLPIRPWSEPGQGHWLLVRRSIADPEDLACYACFVAPETPLSELVRVAGTRWIIEDAFKEAKREVGWTSMRCACGSAGTGTSPPCRSTGQALALLAHAFLAVTRSYAAGGDGKKGICLRENSSH